MPRPGVFGQRHSTARPSARVVAGPGARPHRACRESVAHAQRRKRLSRVRPNLYARLSSHRGGSQLVPCPHALDNIGHVPCWHVGDDEGLASSGTPPSIESGPVARERVGLDAFKLLQRITLGPDWLADFAAKRVALFSKRGQADSFPFRRSHRQPAMRSSRRPCRSSSCKRLPMTMIAPPGSSRLKDAPLNQFQTLSRMV